MRSSRAQRWSWLGCGSGLEESGPHADTLWWLDERTVFAGDIAYNQMHAYLFDAHHASWLTSLATLEARVPDDVTLYLGHGEPAGKPVLEAQRRYIEAFVAAVRAYPGDDVDARGAAVVERMKAIVPDERLQFVMELSIEPVHAALVAVPS